MLDVKTKDLVLPDEYKLTEEEYYELDKVIRIAGQILPEQIETLTQINKKLREMLIRNTSSPSHYLVSIGTQVLGFLFFLTKTNIDEETLMQEWFGKLIVDLLFLMKFNFYRIPTEYIETIKYFIEEIQNKYPNFYKETFVKFLEYEYDDMFFPYQSKKLTFDEYYKNLNMVDIQTILEKIDYDHTVYVVIPFFVSKDAKYINRKSYFVENLHRLNKQSYKNVKIYISMVNVGENVSFAHELKSKYANIVDIAVSPENVGGAKARNIVTREILKQSTDNNFVLFMDDDTYLNDNHVIAKMVYAFENNKDLGCLAPQISYGNSVRSSILEKGFEPPWEFSTFSGFEQLKKESMKSTKLLQDSFLVEASCTMIPTRYLEKTELFPEEYNYYHEETLLENKIRLEQNKRVSVMKNGYVLHQRIGGGAISPFAMFYYYRNFGYFLEDIGVKEKSEDAYNLIMSQFYDYCCMLIEESANSDKLKLRIEQGKAALQEYYRTGIRPLKNDEFNSEGTYKFI
jgi:GT2 family glycosyltransferase